MKMISILVVFALSLPLIHLLNFVAPIAEQSQTKCLQLIKSDIQNQELHRAFFCGQSLSESPLKKLFVSGGLYHLLVVSGSHLIFVTSFLGHCVKGRLAKYITAPVLGVFTLATGFQAPLVRALFAMVLEEISNKQKLFWHRDVIIVGSGLICLLCFPEWMQSQSLILSWTASLAICQGRTLIQKSVLVFFMMLPCLWGWGQFNPLTILSNLFLGPLISFLILLSGIILLLSPSLSELMLNSSVWILEISNEVIAPTVSTKPFSKTLLWGYLCLSTICLHVYRVQSRRRQCKK